METTPVKKPYLSKTLILNLIVAVCAMFGPEVSDYAKPESIILVLTVANMVLRLVTKEKIGLSE